MKTEGKWFGIGVGFTLAVIVIFLFPYRNEILWAYQNRKTIGAAADVGGAFSDLYGSLFK